MFKLCLGDKCKHYGEEFKKGEVRKRSCYYEAGCWKGIVDMMLAVLKFRFRRNGL